MEPIQATVTFPKISSDNLEKFKRLAGEALKIAADEPGILQYDWFFNADETKCLVRAPGGGPAPFRCSRARRIVFVAL
jgi:hypothetical protein